MLLASSAGMTASLRTLQKMAILARSLSGSATVAAADDDLGLDAEAGQLAHAVLGRLGLQLAGGGDIGDERGVDGEAVPRPLISGAFVAELADRLDERQALDVADGAAHLAEQEIADPARCRRAMNSLIALVTCGITWTVAPR